MPWQMTFDPNTRIIFVSAQGQISYDDARDQTRQAMALMKEHGTTRVLADYSEGLSEVSLANLYWLVDFYREISAPADLKAAVILPKSGHRIEAYQFHALAARNAGYNIRLFDTRADGEKWLLEGAKGNSKTE
jgi:cytosine/adenosine deaminase-related metal-dependent hydrolase